MRKILAGLALCTFAQSALAAGPDCSAHERAARLLRRGISSENEEARGSADRRCYGACC